MQTPGEQLPSAFLDDTDGAFPDRASRLVICAGWGKSVRGKVFSTQALQIVLRLPPESDYVNFPWLYGD